MGGFWQASGVSEGPRFRLAEGARHSLYKAQSATGRTVMTSSPPLSAAALPAHGPFALADPSAYADWRAWKLDGYPARAADLVVPVADPARPGADEVAALHARLAKTNMAVYATDPAAGRGAVRALAAAFGLTRLDHNLGADDDGLTAIQVVADGTRTRYIPYTDRPISWHTDGYYNPPERQIRGMVLHCARASAAGGENALMDPEVAYILLRDADPAFVRALGHPHAMTIPANDDAGGEIRAAQTGPVFSIGPWGELHMRYTARARNIVWRDDAATRDAVAFLSDTLAADGPYIFHHRLAPGEGLICNNVLHNRTAFHDGDGDQGRLLYRGRYLDRIAATGPGDVWPPMPTGENR